MAKDAAIAGDLLDRVRNQAEKMAAQNDGLQKGYADLGWDVLEVAEMQYWRLGYDTFRDYLKVIADKSKTTVSQLQRYMLAVRDLSDSFSRAELEIMGITKAIQLRNVKDYAIVLPSSVVIAALDPKITAVDLKKIISTTLHLPKDDGGDWLDLDFAFYVTPEERGTIESAIRAAEHCEPATKKTLDLSAQKKDVVLKWAMEFLATYSGDGYETWGASSNTI